jgi:hypothetical protein
LDREEEEIGNNGLQHKKRENEKNKNKDKKIVVIKLKILSKKGGKIENQFTESSRIIPLASNPGTSTFDWDFLSVPVPSQGWYAGLCGNGCCPSLMNSLPGFYSGFLSPVFPWCDGPSVAGRISEVCPQEPGL